MRITSKEIFTIPNCLSLLRILLIPIFVYVYINATESTDYLVATIIFFIAAISDFLDGKLARKFNLITELGKVLDPVADKLQQAAIAFCLLFRYEFLWMLITLFVVKELFMGINGVILLRRGKKLNGAMWFGKLSTAVFYVAMLSLIAFPEIDTTIAIILSIITAIFLALSFILYIPIFINMYRS
ncbi:CDP-alcohol phosphatidyltransferase family protein [Caldibacillus lycopersici]|uniref:CDP-diacylglycerol--glycerol-3-phosphate 3-phosphatidyltransferase n=1 Tax=Perspicuibacillus lycopersici TaxID=1325689 RepID=A0AAE3LN58_9BACI|nr:CDP-alcohol phosphatidyltransferase family protein [Perspicuibacillus lycopersici]MCU9613512.1 CDP-alcohol phosphatidyltransferase family protein [Perspicuibacillus lycopersici]